MLVTSITEYLVVGAEYRLLVRVWRPRSALPANPRSWLMVGSICKVFPLTDSTKKLPSRSANHCYSEGDT